MKTVPQAPSRELKPDLFGGKSSSESEIEQLGKSSLLAQQEKMADANLIRAFETQMSQLQSKARDWDNRIERMEGRVNEFLKLSQARFEKLGKFITDVDESLRDVQEDHDRKLAHLNSRLNERKVQDSKIEEMIERHNQIVKSFEARLNQLQKIINEKDLQLQKARLANPPRRSN